jgi:hypothetical protein
LYWFYNRIKMISWIKEHMFEIMVVSSIIIILLLACFRIRKKGSWSDYYYYPLSDIKQQPKEPKKDSAGETRARKYLEQVFNKPFPKSRPDFLLNQVTGAKYNLELDCFNPELRLAVEYNGAQHYNYIPFFHKNKEAFYNQKYRDELKRIRCKELGIVLIEIPYTEKNIEDYLDSQLRIFGFKN